MPKLWKSRFYFYPSLAFVAKQISKASQILVADSPPPYTMCEYNLNFPEKLLAKVTYVGHFTNEMPVQEKFRSDLEKLIRNEEFGYWMRTGNKSTNDSTGKKYEQVFQDDEMKNEKRIISHARSDPTIDRVVGKDGKKYSVSDALEKKIDWIQINIGFLSVQEKESVLKQCQYAVINGSHTVMGEIIGTKAKPIIGIPVYDEHTNQLKWAQEKNLGILANSTKQVIKAIKNIKANYSKFEESLSKYAEHFVGNGARNTAQIVSGILEDKR